MYSRNFAMLPNSLRLFGSPREPFKLGELVINISLKTKKFSLSIENSSYDIIRSEFIIIIIHIKSED